MINLNESKSPMVTVPPNLSEPVVLRIKKQKYEKEKKRIVWETEVVAPEKVTLEGQEYILQGQEVTFYNSLSDEIVGKQKMSPLAKLKSFHQKLGLPMEIDQDNLPYEGLMFEFYLQSYDRPMQRKEGNEYKTILDENGKARTLGYQFSSFLDNVIGPTSLSVDAAY